MDYKDSLLLPKTSFSMRGNLPQNEPKRYKSWFEQRDVYGKMKQKRENAQKSFTLHDGPPYANGHIHIGHALNKILKDIIIKTHYFFGEKVKYIPGWDCHGLPIEQQVEKKIGKTKKETLPKTKIRQLCREYAKRFVDIQRDEFKALGVVGDWENPYLTMKYEFEANIYRALCNIAKKGLLKERSKPVYWSWAAKTALAEAEVEYEDKEDFSIYVSFELSHDAKKTLDIKGKKAALVIWTTTPWTLPSNMGISLSPEETYVLTTDGYMVAKKRFEPMKEEGALSGEIDQEFEAKVFENLIAENPLNNRASHIMLGEHVLMDGGSGCVHTAPGHGEDDYHVSLKYDLDVVMPVDKEGKFDETVKALKLIPNPDDFIGRHVFSCNDDIVALLKDAVLKSDKFVHSYPHCWRTHKPVIYRATKQWFIMMDEPEKGKSETLRDIALKEMEGVKFYPEWGVNRLGSMIENRPDWCISRQRDWGVPIAFFRDKNTKEIIFDEKVLDFIADIFDKEGADAWWDKDIKDLLCPDAGYDPENLEKVMDILDVWFDSGSTWKAVLESKDYDAGDYPSSMYLEGSDQHRGWFQSSLLVSAANNGIAPYKSILTHGFTVDEKGEKMSKSKGNVVAPNDIAKKYGVEILRLWVGMSDYTSDLKISENIIKQISEQYRKLRNTFRFLLANVNDLEEVLEFEKFSALDKWIVSHAKKVFDEAQTAFREYDYSKAFSLLNHFVTVELSGIYMDICKDRLYCNAKDDQIRLSAQSAMAVMAKSMLFLIAPVLTYTADEIMEHSPKVIKGDAEDVFDLERVSIPDVKSDFNEEYMVSAREKFFEIVDALKKEKKIKSTLELVVQTTSREFSKLSKTDAEDWFVVSKVISHDEEGELASFEVDGDKFKVLSAAKAKCPRCWKFRAKDEESVCERCKKTLDAINA